LSLSLIGVVALEDAGRTFWRSKAPPPTKGDKVRGCHCWINARCTAALPRAEVDPERCNFFAAAVAELGLERED
jgi:hypothetical protein